MHFKTRILAMTIAGLLPLTAMAIGGPSGPKIDYHTQGHLGEVMMNPYGIAPLTAIIRDGGYTLEDVNVRIVQRCGSRLQGFVLSGSYARRHSGFRPLSQLREHG